MLKIDCATFKSDPSGALDNASALPFCIAGLATLFFKYVSYLDDAITLHFEKLSTRDTAVETDTHTIIISNTHSFLNIYHQVFQLVIISRLENKTELENSIKITWIREDESSANYQCNLKFTKAVCEVNFTCSPVAFLGHAFLNSSSFFETILKQVEVMPGMLMQDIHLTDAEIYSKIQTPFYGEIDEEVGQADFLDCILEQTALKYPDAIAIQFQGLQLTYSHLNNWANILADLLIQKGVQPGDFIGILLNRCPEVYISMLAIMKTGAAYVPIDIGYPEDRIQFILEDAGVKIVLSHTNFKSKCQNYKGLVLNFDKELETFHNTDGGFINSHPNLKTSSPAYIIYTSGSTGRPKGVLVSHASISNLVKGEKKLFNLSKTDAVLQGFSIAFDASIEEIWLAFASGAKLVPATEAIMHSGADLSAFIQKEQITVLSTVPTMLSILPVPLSSLKLIILGGENCPNELLLRWKKNDLRIVNTYGPTEASVIASYADFLPDEKITIGKPMINYAIFITDASTNPLPTGVPGELCIAGKGVATGYLNREALTKEKFTTPSFKLHPSFPNLIYRSGDLARYNEKGQIEFLERIDTQVKLRGYRIELSEIESSILQTTNIKNVVVAVHEDPMKVQKLIAYIVLEDENLNWDEQACKTFLKNRLAAFMVPSLFIKLLKLPLLASGKVDRKKLPNPSLFVPQPASREIIAPRNIMESQLHAIWVKYFAPSPVSVTDDFFDLGGHSLLASLVVSEMRKLTLFEKMSVQDIYTFPTVEKLSVQAELENKKIAGKATASKKKYTRVSSATYALTTLLQSASFLVLMMISATGLISPFLIENRYPDISIYKLIVFSSLFSFSTFPALILFSIVIKWLVIGRFREGRFPLWGFYYFRFWLVKKIIDLTPLGLLSGTPFLNFYFRLMGAKIGQRVYMGSDRMRAFDLFSIGDGSSVSREAHLMGYTVENGELIIGSIAIGKNCYIGTRAVLSENTRMGNGATLGELSHLPANGNIPEGENWEGSQAKKVAHSKQINLFTRSKISKLPYFLYLCLQLLAITSLLIFPLLLLIPFAIILYEIDFHFGFIWLLLSTLPGTAVYIAFLYLFVAATKWVIIGKAKEEDFSIYSIRYIKKWIVDMIMQFTLLYFKSVYATLFLPPWLRLMGAKIGKSAEISTVNQISPDLLSIGDGSFLADSVSIGSPVVRDGVMYLRKIVIGNKTFIGNNAVLACGDTIGSNCLIGVLSVPPFEIPDSKIDGSNWLGSPPIFLPKRQVSHEFPPHLTFNPSKKLVAQRAFIELFKITLPLAIASCLMAFFYRLIFDILTIESLVNVVLLAPVILFVFAASTTLITALFKWILLGKHTPSNKPLWSVFVWKNELINSLCESLVYPFFVNMLQGTPYAPWFFRMMGSKIGKRVFMETTEITEFDLVHIGNEACLNNLCTIQTHLFEDRVMKMAHLYIGNQCSVGALTVALYDSKLEDGSVIDALSLVMKGETIPANTRWSGSPARFA
jgi:non-ribosomal peptide synthetase-like protein